MRIKSIEIEGLHGYMNKKLNFSKDETYLVGINGSGKTSILKIIEAFFKQDSEYFEKILFDFIIIETIHHKYKIFSITDKEKKTYCLVDDKGEEKEFKEIDLKFKKERLISIGLEDGYNQKKLVDLLTKIKKNNGVQLEEEIKELLAPIELVNKFLQEEANKYFFNKSSIDLKGLKGLNKKTKIIIKRLEEIEKNLDKMMEKNNLGEILENKKLGIIDVFTKIDEIEKEKKDLRKDIDSFLKVINYFLNDSYKKIIFDENLGKFRTYVLTEKLKKVKEIKNLNLLSSGEKQIIILITFLKFGLKNNSIILIDEPEKSLHIEWQKKFLSKIKEFIFSKEENKQLIVATHSANIVGEVEREKFTAVYPYNKLEDLD